MKRELYPEINEFDNFMLETNSEHRVYVEQAGNQSGIPILFLHGGPGSGCNENHRRYFDPKKYRIILFDQRGCHRSIPNGCENNNTTTDILNDIEAIRKLLNIDKWVLFGGSWGATLALLYAEHYPNEVSGIILRGAFLARKKDLSWFIEDGVNRIYPDYWSEFLSIFNENEKNNLLDSMHNHIFSDNREIQLEAARAWSLWAGRVVTNCLEGEYSLEDDEDEEKLINDVKIETHYAKNKYFVDENQIINNIKKIGNVPIMIIHGEKDLTCLPESSSLLHKLIPESKLTLVSNAGHLAGEPAITNALICATDDMSNLVNE